MSGRTLPTISGLMISPRRNRMQITHSLVGGIRSEDMVEPFLVHYPSKDGKWQISVVRLRAVQRGEERPECGDCVAIHGGPDAINLQTHLPRHIQYLVNQGYFVIAPNYRGSTGYGKEFEDADRFDMGGGDLDDVIAAAEWIKKTGFIDPKKIGGRWAAAMAAISR